MSSTSDMAPWLGQAEEDLRFPEDVVVEDTIDGVRYILPGRLLGGGHVFGAAIVVAGIVIVLAGLWWATQVAMNGPGGGPGPLIALIPAVAVILIGAILWSTGLYIAGGRSELEFRGSPPRLRRIERAGLLRWTVRKPAARLTRLHVEIGLTQDKTIDEAITSGVAIELGSLIAEFEGGRTARLLIAYPPHWLEAIANDLADRIAQHPARHAPDGADAQRPEVVVRDAKETNTEDFPKVDQDEPLAQPEDSDIDVTRTSDGLTFTIPPLGLLQSKKGALSTGAMWNGVVAAFAGGAFGFMNSPWFLTLVIGTFWGVGTLVMLAAVSLGRRSAIVDVIEDRAGRALLISQRTLFGVKQRGWRASELRSIECGPSGMEVNEQPVMQLQITPSAGGTSSFFTGRSADELRWLARLLREALELERKVE